MKLYGVWRWLRDALGCGLWVGGSSLAVQVSWCILPTRASRPKQQTEGDDLSFKIPDGCTKKSLNAGMALLHPWNL